MKTKSRFDADSVTTITCHLDATSRSFEIEEDVRLPTLNVAELLTLAAHTTPAAKAIATAIMISPWRPESEADSEADEPGFRPLGFDYSRPDRDELNFDISLPAPLFEEIAQRSTRGELSQLDIRADCVPDKGLAATIRGLTLR